MLEVEGSARLLALLESDGGWRDPDGLLAAVGTCMQADALCLEESSSLSAPLATWFHPEGRQHDIHGALHVLLQRLPSPLDYPYPIHWTELLPRAGAQLLTAFPEDAWVDRLAIGEPGEDRGTLTLIGAGSRGCPPLSVMERRVLRNVCGPMLVLAGQQRRVQQLEGDLRLLGTVGQGLAARASTLERLKRAVIAIQEETLFESVQVVTWNPNEKALLLNVLYLREDGFVPDQTWDQMTPAEIRASSQQFIQNPSPRFIADPAELPGIPTAHRRWFRAQEIRFLVFVPLLFADQHLGTVVLTSRFSREITEARVRSITTVGGHIAAVLQLALLLTQVQEAYGRLRASHRSTVETLALAAEMRDATTGQHLQHLRDLSTAIGRQLRLSDHELEELGYAAVVHDIGKLEVPDAVLLKPGRLTPDEWAIIEAHTTAGEELLARSEVPQVVRDVVRWHHERWDGTGYPDRLIGDEIPLAVQIVSVADVFDALTSERPYKKAWKVKRAVDEIRRGRGTHFSPTVVDAFLAISGTLALEEREHRSLSSAA